LGEKDFLHTNGWTVVRRTRPGGKKKGRLTKKLLETVAKTGEIMP